MELDWDMVHGLDHIAFSQIHFFTSRLSIRALLTLLSVTHLDRIREANRM